MSPKAEYRAALDGYVQAKQRCDARAKTHYGNEMETLWFELTEAEQKEFDVYVEKLKREKVL